MSYITLTEGDAPPGFILLDQAGAQRALEDYHGKWLLIYFYPKDDTPGCTKEACAVRDNLPDFTKLDLAVVGISADSVASHKKFADKYELSFPLLADEDKSVVNAYGVWGTKKFMGKEFEGILRTSFLIDPDGKIAKIYENVNPAHHVQEVLADIRARNAA